MVERIASHKLSSDLHKCEDRDREINKQVNKGNNKKYITVGRRDFGNKGVVKNSPTVQGNWRNERGKNLYCTLMSNKCKRESLPQPLKTVRELVTHTEAEKRARVLEAERT